MRYLSVLVVVGAVLASAGCGSSDDSGSDESTNVAVTTTTTTPPVDVTVSAPGEGQTIRDARVTVRGTVAPQTATVKVLGRSAEVSAGVFSRSVRLEMGENRIDVVATAEGQSPATTTVTVTRGRTEAALAAASKRKKARAAKRAAAKRERAAKKAAAKRAAAAAPVTVPDLTNVRLDVAERRLRQIPLRYTEVGGGAFGIVVKANWTVCSTSPGAGAQVKKRTRIDLIVDRAC